MGDNQYSGKTGSKKGRLHCELSKKIFYGAFIVIQRGKRVSSVLSTFLSVFIMYVLYIDYVKPVVVVVVVVGAGH